METIKNKWFTEANQWTYTATWVYINNRPRAVSGRSLWQILSFASSMKLGSRIQISRPIHFPKRQETESIFVQPFSFTRSLQRLCTAQRVQMDLLCIDRIHSYLKRKKEKKIQTKWLYTVTSLKCGAIKIKSYLFNSQLQPISVNDAVPLRHTRLPRDQIKIWALTQEKDSPQSPPL